MIKINLINNCLDDNNKFNELFELLESTNSIINKKYKFLVKEDLKLTFSANGIRIVTIPKGFIFDGLSLNLFGMKLKRELFFPALIHDYYYSSQMVSRKDADKILFSMICNDHSKLLASVIFMGVRLFGGRYYGRDWGYFKFAINK